MSQENQGTNSAPMENAPVKRKRGRPRKDENLVRGEPSSTSPLVTDMARRNRRRRIDQTTDPMVGQVVSGVLEGSFDAGYLLTVRVGDTNTVLRGVVFEPGLSVPISVVNDVAPHVKMFKRNEIPLPTQVHGPNFQSEQNNERIFNVSVNEGVLPSKVSPPVKQVPRAPQLSPSQVQTPMASSKGEINDANNVAKTAPHALQPEESKAKSSPSRPAKRLAGEASGDANHAVLVSSQPAASQTENRMPTDVMQNDKSGLPTRVPEGLPVNAGQVIQVSMQTEAPQTEKRKSIDVLLNEKSDLPASEPEGVPSAINQVVHVPSQAEASKSTYVLANNKFDLPARDPEGPPNDASQVVEDSVQAAAASQRENRKSTNVLPDDKTDLLTRELDGSNEASLIKPEQVVQPVLQGESSATQPLQLEHDRAVVPAEMHKNEAAALFKRPLENTNAPEHSEFIPSTEPSVEKLSCSESIDQVTQVQPHAMICKLEPGWHSDDALTSEHSALFKRRHLENINAAHDSEFIPSTEPSVEKLSCSESIDQVTQVQSHAVICKLEPGWHSDDALTSERPKVNLNCIPVSDPPQPVAAQPDNEASNLHLENINAAEDSEFIPSTEPSVEKLSCSEFIDQVTQVQSHAVICKLEPGWHSDDALTSERLEVNLNCIPVSDPPQPVAAQPDNEASNLHLENINAAEDSEFIPSTEPSVEKLSSCSESIDRVTQVQSHAVICKLEPGWHSDDALTSERPVVNLNCVPVSDPPQPVAAQPDNEVSNLLEKKASPKGHTPEDLTPKPSDEIPSRTESSHLDGKAIADASEATEGHTESEPQTRQQVDVVHKGSSPAASSVMEAVHAATVSMVSEKLPQPQLSNSAMAMQNEDDISKDASLLLEMLHRKTSSAAYDTGAEHVAALPIHTKEIAGWHSDDALTSVRLEVNLNCIPVSDPPQPVAAQPDNEVSNLLEKKASPKGHTPEDLTPKPSDEIPSRADSSHLDGRAIADASEATEGHTKSERQARQQVDVVHKGSSPAASSDMEAVHAATVSVVSEELPQPQLSNSAMAMQNEDDISKDASLLLELFQRKTSPAAYDTGVEHVTAQSIHTKEVAESQISDSSLSMQNEDSIYKDAVPSEQSQVLQKGTTPTVLLDLGAATETTQSFLPKEVPEHQISISTLPIQNEDIVSKDASPSVQSQCDPVELKVTDSMSA